MSGRKIAAATVQNRSQTPFWNWLKQKLLASDRLPITPPPGIAGEDGKAVYQNPLRFPNTQSARPGSAELPTLPGGVHHKLADNYYLTRDGRRTVQPPQVLYASGEFNGAAAQPVQVNQGVSTNFGLTAPTPGFGAEWNRSKQNELSSQQNNTEFEYLQRFDKFAKSN
uniref:NADH dehydrogenase [ubiquinone] 1 alpha subcomplex subunit 7 n=1 Tax=Caenorhabditis tropicalis TaxID=1561998 RepID=A0A1I7UUF6_9PELO